MSMLRTMAALAFIFFLGYPNLPAQTAAKEDKEDPFFSGPPFSFNDLLQRVGVIADRRLRVAVLRRGINFSPSPANYAQLKKAGATPELIQLLATKAPPPPPPPAPKVVEPPPVAGDLTLHCAPAECNITINGKPHGATSKGVLKVVGLPPGNAAISFIKDGFEGQEISIALKAATPESRSVTLKATAATLARAGKELLAKMVTKLGGADALQQSSLVSGAGNASLWQSGGQRTEWRLISRVKLPAMALIEINGAGLKWWTSLAGSDSKTDGSRQMKGGAVAVEMEKLVRLYRDYQPAMLVSRLGKMKLAAADVAPDSNGVWRLVGSDADGSLTVLLNSDFLLTRVIYESASGLGSGLEVLYSDYATVGKAMYPKSMTIKFADQPQHGLEVRLDAVNFVATLANRDFHR